MGLLAVLVAGLLGWAVWTGRLGKPDPKSIAALVLAVVGGAIAARGRPLIGGGMAAAGLLWLSRRPVPKKVAAAAPEIDPATRDALELLGLPPSADRAAVMEAHRRLIARNHPDAGGTEALARSINAARDTLLKRLPG